MPEYCLGPLIPVLSALWFLLTTQQLIFSELGGWLLEPDIGDWTRSAHLPFDRATEITLATEDYHKVELINGSRQPSVGLFMAWYADQSAGGVHSPEICLPGAAREIVWLDRTNIAPQINAAMIVNSAINQKGETRRMEFYWSKEKSRKIGYDVAAKMWLIYDGLRTDRTEGGIVRLTTLIARDETDTQAEARLMDVLVYLQGGVPRFIT